MSSVDAEGVFFRSDLYEESFDGIKTLKSKLPEDSVRLLADEVIARLASRVREAPTDFHVKPSDIDKLARALIAADSNEAARFIQRLRDRGARVEHVYLGYLAPAARLLGEWWVEDEVTFMSVTIGSSRIFAIMRALSHLLTAPLQSPRRAAVFASVPNETHTLGVKMASDLFRKEGWDIDLQIGLDHSDLVEHATRSDVKLIGLSSGGSHSRVELAKLVVALRLARPDALLMVSGNIVNEEDDLVAVLGVDGVANSMPEARATLENLWGLLQRPAR